MSKEFPVTDPTTGNIVQPRTTSILTDTSEPDSGSFLLAEDHPPATVETTSRYRIISELGRGGMGIVYRARDLSLNRDVAVKILLREYLNRPELAEQFTVEARIMGSLQHPGIAQVYECGHTDDGRPFHSMKLVNGRTMFAKLYDGSQNDIQKSVRLLNIFSLICQTMAYTHSKQVIHLDLKPANIMIGPFGEVHVMDWGLARSLGPDTALPPNQDVFEFTDFTAAPAKETKAQVNGTLEYMAPEQARAETVDYATDVFCLGAILCHILTGDPPYPFENPVEMLRKAQIAELAPVWKRLENCEGDVALVRLAQQCLQESPHDRPTDATEVAKEIAHYNESNLERALDDMALFFELSDDLFCIAGFDGFFRRLNCNFSKVLGYSDDQLLARPIVDFIVEEDRLKTIEFLDQLTNGQPVGNFRNRYRCKDGHIIEFEWAAKSIPGKNMVSAVAKNITRRP